MKAPHLLRVEEGPEPFAPLFAALAAAGLHAGWLDLRQPEAAEPAGPSAASLETAAALGARRAVAAGGGRSVAWKALRGEPVLRDLLREHFLGCALVLVRGAPAPAAATAAAVPLAAVPALSPAGDSWRIARAGDAAVHHYDTPGLVAVLRRPRPWGSGGGGRPDAPDAPDAPAGPAAP